MLPLLIACAVENGDPKDTNGDSADFEGDDAGECADAADNDRDGAFDCDDDDCAASPDCASTPNSPPSAPGVSITPGDPTTGDDLACVVSTPATDVDGDSVTYSFSWTVDGQDGGAIEAVSAALTSAGQTWTCTVTPSDPLDEGEAASASVTIKNSAPTSPIIAIDPADPTDSDDLACVIVSPSADADGDEIAYTYSWMVDGVDTGLMAATVSAALTSGGQEWICSVSTSDGTDQGDGATAAVEIGNSNTAPTAPLVSVAPLGPLDDDDLACSIDVPSSDVDGDTISYRYVWLLDGVATSETGSSVGAAVTSPGETWTCQVAGSDGSAEGAVGTASVVILASGCADGDTEGDSSWWGRDDIAFCESTTGALPTDVADASALCASGWHVCLAAEFTSRNDTCAQGNRFSGVIDDGDDCMVHDDGGGHSDGGWDCDQDTYNDGDASYLGTCTSSIGGAPSAMLGYYEYFSGGDTQEGALCCQ